MVNTIFKELGSQSKIRREKETLQGLPLLTHSQHKARSKEPHWTCSDERWVQCQWLIQAFCCSANASSKCPISSDSGDGVYEKLAWDCHFFKFETAEKSRGGKAFKFLLTCTRNWPRTGDLEVKIFICEVSLSPIEWICKANSHSIPAYFISVEMKEAFPCRVPSYPLLSWRKTGLWSHTGLCEQVGQCIQHRKVNSRRNATLEIVKQLIKNTVDCHRRHCLEVLLNVVLQ